MANYTDGSASNRNFDDLDIEGSNAEDFLEPQLRSRKTPEEIHLLKHCTVELDDGRHGYVFSYEEDKTGAGTYFCHVCQTSLSGWSVVNQHICGVLHTAGMQRAYHPRANFTRIVEEDTTVELQPGEPAPPGMEDMVEPKKCIIQSKLDAFKLKPLIGLEYLIEMLGESGEPKYYCLLCNKQGVNNNIITHLSSHIHYLKYLQKYFPAVYNALMLVPKTPEYKKGYSIVLTRVVSRIEGKFGRLKPRQTRSESNQRFELLNVIDNEFHFRETPQDDYASMVDWTEMKKLQFYNEDDDVVPVKNVAASNSNLEEKDSNNKSLFNKAGRINVDKRQLRKDRESLDDDASKDKESSPDLVIIGEMKKPADRKIDADRKSLSSISSVSSISDDHSRSRSRSRSSVRGRYRSPDSRYRRRSRSLSSSTRRKLYGSSRYHHSRSRSRSRSPSRRYRHRMKSRSNSRSRSSRYKRDYSPVLPYPKRRRSYSRSHSRSRSRSPGIPLPKYRRFQRYSQKNRKEFEMSIPRKDSGTTRSSQKYKWDKFREELRTFAKELDVKQKYYEKNPEKHPQYPEEWKMFWNRRYKEIQAEGKDPAKHDFKPEWITFWNTRMKEIHDEEFKLGKEKLKLKVGVNEEEPKKEFDGDKSEEHLLPEKNDVTVDDIKNTWKALTGSEIKEGNRSPTSSINEDSEPFPRDHFDVRRSQSHLVSRLPPPGVRQGFIPFDDNAPRVISVLRMISVLESQLGSLGPKVVDLLAKAIAMEKTSKGSSQDILCDEEHNVLFETVKEKLKGMLFAGLVDRNFVNMTKVALRNIEDLFLSAPKVFKKEKPSYVTPASAPGPGINTASPVTVPGVGTVDRVAIAQQIAGALIAQGKTDLTENELEQLINAVVGMAQASSNSAAPITTAEYIKKAQNLVSEGNENTAAASEGLKLLQAAYDEDENRGNSDRNPDPPIPTNNSIEKATGSLNNSSIELSDKDLRCLLSNFKELKPDEQSKFINYYKKLESTDPERFLLLQKSVNVKGLLIPDVCKTNSSSDIDGGSTYPDKAGASNSAVDESQKIVENIDDSDEDDDDYSVDDVYKAASEKLRQQEMSQKRKKIESMLANMDEAAKKGDIINNLSAAFQIPQVQISANKNSNIAVGVQQPPSDRPQSLKDIYQVYDKNSQNYTGHYNSQPSVPVPAVDIHSSQIGNNYGTYPLNPNPYPDKYPGNDQFRNMGVDRASYSSGFNTGNQFPQNRGFPYPNNSSIDNRFPPPDVHNQFEPPNYGQGRQRHYY